jgi:hypothetical protein
MTNERDFMIRLIIVLILLLFSEPICFADDQIGEVLGHAVYRQDLDKCEDVSLRKKLESVFYSKISSDYIITHTNEFQPNRFEIDYVRRYLIRMFYLANKQELDEIYERFTTIISKGKNVPKSSIPNEVQDEFMQILVRLDPYRNLISGLSVSAKEMLFIWKSETAMYKQYGGGRVIRWANGIKPLNNRYGKKQFLVYAYYIAAFDARPQLARDYESKGLFKITDPKLRDEFYANWSSVADIKARVIDDIKVIEREFLHPEWEPIVEPIEQIRLIDAIGPNYGDLLSWLYTFR